MQIHKFAVGLISVLLLGGVLGIWQSLESGEKPNSAIAVSDVTARISLPLAAAPVPMRAELLRNADAMAPPVAVSYREGLLSIHAHRAALRDVLVAVTQATGATFAVDDDAGQAVTVAVGPAPLQQAVADLMQRIGYGHALISGDHKTQGVGPVHVVLLRRGGAVGSPQGSTWAPDASVVAEPGLAQINEIRPAVPDPATLLQHRVFDQIMEACKQQECNAS